MTEQFSPADMATAAAQGFGDGVASLSANAGEPVAWRLRNTAFRSEVYEYFKTKYLAECRQKQFNASVDDGGLHDLTPLYAAPPTAQAEGWISVEDSRKPPPGKPVVFWAWAERYQEDDEGRQITQDVSGLHLGEWRESENGNYFDNYSTPFADREAVLWWMDPAPPTSAEWVEHG